jgi:predicted O-methyltransferase YrrM
MNLQHFTNDTFVPLEFLKLKNEFNIEVAVETGTNKGHTTYWLAQNFNSVYTFEITPPSLNEAKEYCKHFDNIKYFEGSTIQLLSSVISEIKDKRVIFFLDAHGTSYTPTIYELMQIKNMNIKPIICIHDFYVPGKDYAWGDFGDFAYKWENIENFINDIYGYGNYEYYYNSEANGYNVGVIYIKPKK